MLTKEVFAERLDDLWQSQKRMAAPKKWKSGKRAGIVRKAGAAIEFTRDDLGRWLWKQVGLNAVPCPFCSAPIDILSLTIDHIVPRSMGGRFALDNMECCCEDCNHRKGPMSRHGFLLLLQLGRQHLSSYDFDVLLQRLKAAHQGSANRFFRDKGKKEPRALPPPLRSSAAQQLTIQEPF